MLGQMGDFTALQASDGPVRSTVPVNIPMIRPSPRVTVIL